MGDAFTSNLKLPKEVFKTGITDARTHNAAMDLLDELVGGQLSWKAPVATFAALPVGILIGEARVVLDVDTIYIWNGSAWNKELPGLHAATHEDGGVDEVGIAGLSGLTGDPQLPIAPQEATATATTTTTGIGYALLAGMTLTPGAGNYLVNFSTTVDHDSSNESIWVSLYVNGVQVADTERLFRRGGASGNVAVTLAFNKYITGVLDTQIVEVRWRTTAATASAYQRTLTLLKVA